MKGGTVMPEIIFSCRLEISRVCHYPFYFFSCITQSLFRPLDGRFRNIEHGDILVTQIKQMIHKETITTTDVNNPGSKRYMELFQELKGGQGNRLIPADFVGLLCLVYIFP